jgi:hypothetical protein
MKVLVMGLRQGLCRALERRNLSYILWNHNKVSSKLKAECIIQSPYLDDEVEFLQTLNDNGVDGTEITHVIAGSEAPVVFASLARKWLKVKRNPHSLILKCTDKLTMKKFLCEKKVPMAKFVDIKKCRNKEELISILGLPLVIKARNSSGGRGLEFIKELSDDYFQELKKNARRLDLYCEAVIKGREGSIESFVQNHEIVFTNITEYYVLGHCNIVPATYSDELQEKIRKLNEIVIKALNIKWGMTHLEFYDTEEGLLFGEVALRPPGGHIMDCLELSYKDNFWDHFLNLELHKEDIFFSDNSEYSAAYIFHPGHGQVKEVKGQNELKEIETIKKWKLKLKVGDQVEPRLGVGNDTGYALLSSPDKNILIKSVDRIRSELRVEFI